MPVTPALYIKRIIYRLLHWETWHWLLKYVPMAPFWVAYCAKAGSPWFFSAANPTLTFGGFEGETKHEMYSLLPPDTYPKTFLIKASAGFAAAEEIIRLEKLSFPVAVKPDAGRMGLMFRKINSLSQLRQYHHTIQADYLLQKYIDYPMEVSVFYYRIPEDPRGTISGFVKKESLCVTGDGTSTLLELMNQYSRVWFRMNEMKTRHASQLQSVIRKGESYILSEALNLSRGGKLVSLESEKDDRLQELFDRLSHHGKFYYGRYDIRCASIEDLKAGRNFSILEFNGSGAEPHHVYGNQNSLWRAIGILLMHWKVLYDISIQNHRRGIPYWNFAAGLAHLRKARRHISRLRALESDSASSFNKKTFQDHMITVRTSPRVSSTSLSKMNTNATT